MSDEALCGHEGRTLLLLAAELSADEVEAARAHLRSCAPCRTLRDDLARVEEAYASSGPTLAGGKLDAMVAALPPRAPRTSERPRERGPRLTPGARRPTGAGDRDGRRPTRRHARVASLAAVSAAAVFVVGLGVGSWLERAPAAGSPNGIDRVADLGAGSPVSRLQAVAALGETPVAGLEHVLVERLTTEPSPNVRLALLDALRGRTLDGELAARLLETLSTEPVPTLRVEIVTLVAGAAPPGLDTVLTRLSREDRSPAVRDVALRTLTLEMQP